LTAEDDSPHKSPPRRHELRGVQLFALSGGPDDSVGLVGDGIGNGPGQIMQGRIRLQHRFVELAPHIADRALRYQHPVRLKPPQRHALFAVGGMKARRSFCQNFAHICGVEHDDDASARDYQFDGTGAKLPPQLLHPLDCPLISLHAFE
jgi:hypothetical protein